MPTGLQTLCLNSQPPFGSVSLASNSPSTFSIDAVLRAICVASSDAWCFAPKDSTELTHCSQQFLQLFGLSHPLPATSGRKIAIADSELQNACRGFGLPEDWFSLQFSAAEPPASADGTVTTEHFTVTHRPVPDEHDQVIGKLLLFRADKARLEASIWQRAAEARKELSTLSVRETEILNLVSRGLTNKAVARQANISEKTVEKHRANIMRKLRLRSVADLIRRVTEASIIEATD